MKQVFLLIFYVTAGNPFIPQPYDDHDHRAVLILFLCPKSQLNTWWVRIEIFGQSKNNLIKFSI